MLGTGVTVKLPSTFSYAVGVVRCDAATPRARARARGRKPLGRPVPVMRGGACPGRAHPSLARCFADAARRQPIYRG
jgi:hypothetical protein